MGATYSPTVVVGVLGCGYWGSKHLRVLSSLPGVRVVAIDADADRLANIQASLGISVSAQLSDVIEGLDAVVIATPPQSHAPLAAFALDHGLHVLVEKPMATSSAAAKDLIMRSERANKTLMVGHTFEYNSVVRALREVIASNALGDVLYVDAARLNLGLYQHDVNVVWDLAVHDVSITNFLFGSTPSTVSAWGMRCAHATIEDVAYINLAYDNPNINVHVHVSWLDPKKVRRVTVVGSEKMAVYNDLLADEQLRIFDKGLNPAKPQGNLDVAPMTYRYGDIVSPHIEVAEPLYAEDSHFLECIRTGCRPLTDGYNGAAVVSVLEAVEKSIRSGKAENVDYSSVVATAAV